MGHVVMFGVDAQTAALDARTPYALDAEAARAAMRRLARCPGVRETFILSTCNRTEVYAVGTSDWERSWPAAVWPATRPIALPVVRRDGDAVGHLYGVVCGLEATLLGDGHIAGQVRDAYARAVSAGTVGTTLHHLCQQAFRTAKRVRQETALGVGRVTLGGVVVQWTDERGVPPDARVAVLGTGTVAVDVARHLGKRGRRVTLVSRDPARAAAVAATCGATAASLARVEEWLVEADVVIGATRTDHPVLGHGLLCTTRQGRAWPLLVDLGVPRNFDAPGVVRATVDDMVGRMDGARAAREAAVPAARALIADAVGEWEAWRRLRAAVPDIVDAVASARRAGGVHVPSPSDKAALHRQVMQLRHRALAGRSRRAFRHAAA